jgi:hypothetical protein
MAIHPIRLCLCGMGLLLALAAAPARAQEFHLGTSIDAVAGVVRYDISGAPASGRFTLLAASQKGVTKVSGMTYQGAPVPMFMLGLSLPTKPIVTGNTDSVGAAKGQIVLSANATSRLKTTNVYFQAFALAVRQTNQKPQAIVQVSNLSAGN